MIIKQWTSVAHSIVQHVSTLCRVHHTTTLAFGFMTSKNKKMKYCGLKLLFLACDRMGIDHEVEVIIEGIDHGVEVIIGI